MEINLNWKNFQVKLDRMHKYLKEQCSQYDGMIATEEHLKVILKLDIQEEIDIVNEYWNSRTNQTESSLNQDELYQNVKSVIEGAMRFGNQMIIEYASENVLMGITQAGKTKAVADYLSDVVRYMQTGSLYEVIHEIDRLKSEGIPSNLSPFVTDERLEQFKQKVVNYLS